MIKKTIAAFCCLTLLISGLTMSNTSAQSVTPQNEEDLTYFNELGIDKDSVFYDVLIAIEELPENVESAEEIAQLLSIKTGLPITAEGEYLDFGFLSGKESSEPIISTYDFTVPGALACIGALGGLVPATKILKINKVLKAAGGAVNVMKYVHMNYKYYRVEKKYSKKKALNQALEDFSVKEKLSSGSKALLKDFFNISAIGGACAPLFTYNENLKNEVYFLNEDNAKMLA
ncbi:hypothetical protein [Sporosarcina sp. FSL W7-1283]|uniref:hypothetical protein n=1 Tax=Sporosarcina sp. FSL W7-1283 TaxID=2921560 RepID=UPI0030F72724